MATIAPWLQDRRRPPEEVAGVRARAEAALAPGGDATHSDYHRATCEAILEALDWLAGDGPDPLGRDDLRPDPSGIGRMVTRAADAENASRGGVREGALWQTFAWFRVDDHVLPPV